MLIINTWTGRLGNNILQIVRAIHYGLINNHETVTMPSHQMLSSSKIVLGKMVNNKTIITDTFFSLQKYNLIDPEPYIMKEYFQRFVNSILKIRIENANIVDNKKVYIHFRGGDIFSNNPHKAYVQPPLSYYKTIIKEYDSIKLVCEDKMNPCVNELLKQENVEYISNTLEKDLSILSNVSNVVIGFGTFGFLLYLMNPNLKNLYIPDFFVNELPTGKWGNDINIHIIELPNYIKVGEWKNSDEQRKMMIKY